LIPAGCELNARHIKVLRTWGIAEIQVNGEEQSSTTLLKIAPEVLARLEGELSKLFWDYDKGAVVQQEVFKLALRRRARAILNNAANH
jgi:hypothetical protein